MFFLGYLRSELTRRKGRTILTALGLGLGVALVVAVSALGSGLDKAQKEVLGPLAGVATDLTVTRPALSSTDGRRGPGQAAELFAENATLGTDLSSLGKAGTKFKRDLFTATQLTFPDSDANKVAAIDGVQSVARALTLTVTHQEGTVPKITAEIETGGNTVKQDVEPMTDAERKAFRECVQQQQGSGQASEPGAGPTVVRGPGAFEKCLPARLQGQATFVVPRQRIRQDVNAPQTDIKTTSYTVTGIQPKAGVNVISSNELTAGRFLGDTGEAMVAESYADQHKIKRGDTLTIGNKAFTVVGLVKAPLSGQTTDVYLSLTDLQKISDRSGRSNQMVVRTNSASQVSSVSSEVKKTLDGAQVADAADLAKSVNGSLVDSANIAHRLGLALAIVALVAAFGLASLLTLGGVAKRVRELGTLKAIGWRPRLVVRQVIAESAVVGILGGLVGAGLGFGAAAMLGRFAPKLSAEAAASSGPQFGTGFFARRVGEQAESAVVSLQAPVHARVVLLAVALAIVGGLIAGAIGATRAARLKPADAMRDVG